MADISGNDTVAIVGMACRFAGCANLRDYWLRILSGTPAFSDSPDPEAQRFLSGDPSRFSHVSTLRGGYLRDLWQTNPAALDIPAAALPGIAPECALTADLMLQSARSGDFAAKAPAHDRIGLFLGYTPHLDSASVNWCQHGIVVDQTVDLIRRCFPHGSTEQFETLRQSLESTLPRYDSRNITTLFGDSIISLITDRFDICGPAYCINAGANSSHLAIQAGCDALLSRRVDLVAVGGVQSVLSPQALMPYSKLGVLSKSNAIHPYGQDADGILLGEGAGILALKRLDDAIRDQDRIFAVIRAVSTATSGNSAAGGKALASAIRSACRLSETPSGSIALVEGEGAAYPLQDRNEVKAMASVCAAEGLTQPGTIALGSVKALIGHTGSAAGIAGTIKAALALYHRVIPPSQEAERPNTQLKLQETPFYLNLSPRPWIHNDQGLPRRAAVTAMSYEGSSSCLILEQYRGTP